MLQSGLSKYKIAGFFTIVDVARAKEFYRDTLGRLFSEEPPFALGFDANVIMLRLGMGKQLPARTRHRDGRTGARRRPAVRDLEEGRSSVSSATAI